MTIQDENLLAEFLAESREHLGSIEPDLLMLEKEAQNVEKETINRIFRAIHSIKGSASFFGFETLKRLSHVMESLLMQIRDGKLSPESDVVDKLLAGVDKLDVLINDIHNSDYVNCESEIADLDAVLKGQASQPAPEPATEPVTAPIAERAAEPPAEPESLPEPSRAPAAVVEQASPVIPVVAAATAVASAAPESSPAAFGFDPKQLAQAVNQGKTVFNIQFDTTTGTTRDLSNVEGLLASMGAVLAIAPEGIDLSQPVQETIHILYATVLEKSMLAAALSLPETAIELFDVQAHLSEGELNRQKLVVEERMREAVAAVEASTEAATVKEPEDTAEPVAAQPKSEKPGAGGEVIESIRVRVDLLNKLMNLAGEMVLIRNQLSRTLKDDMGKVEGLSPIMQNLDLATSDLQEHIMQTRMQPIGNIFGKFPRIVRDLAKKLNKEINIELFGEDVELDKSLIEVLSDPLNHLIRNCCDHGIEPPDIRQKNNKPAKGTITLRAFHEGGQINISIMDDGRGIDSAKVAEKAVKAGAITQAEIDAMSHRDLMNLIFLPGLSTAEKVSDVSGRGVGMDVVKTNIEKLGGHIAVDSEPGMGTSILLRLPLTLAIIPSLIVSVQDYRFAISQVNLVELICIKASEISSRVERVGSATVLRLRGKLLPLVRLADILGIERNYYDLDASSPLPDRRQSISNEQAEPDDEDSAPLERRQSVLSDYFVVVLQVGNHQYGLIVDNVLDLEEIVVKPLSAYFKHCLCFNGATIMGDGKVALILDASGILNTAKMSFAEIQGDDQKNENASGQDSKGHRESVLLFNNDLNEVFAIPLASVLRLEKFNRADIETVGRREFITYRDHGLPLVRLENHLPIKGCPDDLDEYFLIIPKTVSQDEKAVAGIVASRIIDAIEAELELDNTMMGQMGTRGTAIIQNKMSMVIDAESLLQHAGLIAKQELAHV